MGVNPPKGTESASAPLKDERKVTAPTAQSTPTAAQMLGIEIRGLRMRLGVSQRQLVRKLGLQAHSNMGDYENGRRIPPADIVTACEQALHAPHGHLLRLRAEALADRARQWRDRQLSEQRDADTS
jgi:transcriptional regulator with XRE-family HTH domain